MARIVAKARNLVAFLTVLPVGMDKDYLTDSAELMFLFPLVGALVGLIAGVFALGLRYLLPAPLVGILCLALIMLVTGLHHMDGLLDFGDGLMRTGTPERKIEAMHDVSTGTGGLVLGLVTIVATATAIGELRPSLLLQGLVLSEALARLSMVLEARVGKSAHEGMNTPFVEAMHGRWGNLRTGFALVSSVAVSFLVPWHSAILSVAGVVLVTLVLVWLSKRHFNGVTGDVFGATNELARMTALLTLVATT